jgi:hypothetical protein
LTEINIKMHSQLFIIVIHGKYIYNPQLKLGPHSFFFFFKNKMYLQWFKDWCDLAPLVLNHEQLVAIAQRNQIHDTRKKVGRRNE